MLRWAPRQMAQIGFVGLVFKPNTAQTFVAGNQGKRTQGRVDWHLPNVGLKEGVSRRGKHVMWESLVGHHTMER